MPETTADARAALPPALAEALAGYEVHLRSQRDLSPHTVRGYVTDVVLLLDHLARRGGNQPHDLDQGHGGIVRAEHLAVGPEVRPGREDLLEELLGGLGAPGPGQHDGLPEPGLEVVAQADPRLLQGGEGGAERARPVAQVGAEREDGGRHELTRGSAGS